MKRYVIPAPALPWRLPVQTTVTTLLVLDRLAAPGWAWGVVCTMLVVLWILSIAGRSAEVVKPLPGYGVVE